MVHYAININGKIYEGSEDKATAIMLYNSVDSTCLNYLDGEIKTLVREDGEERTELKRNTISIPKRLRHRIEVKEYILETWGDLDKELAEALTTLAMTQEERADAISHSFPPKPYEVIETTIEEEDKVALSILNEATKNNAILP